MSTQLHSDNVMPLPVKKIVCIVTVYCATKQHCVNVDAEHEYAAWALLNTEVALLGARVLNGTNTVISSDSI